jgi:phosphoenolpyruvate carboxykinase (GTP)
VFLGSIMGSEKTAAAAGGLGDLRFDPMAMLPFCGYDMADYFGHWLAMGRTEGARLPRIFMVNWFRKDDEDNYLWPGFGENSRVLEWVFRRCDDEAEAVETPVGLLPAEGAIDVSGLDLPPGAMERLLSVDPEAWRTQLPQIQQHFAQFGDGLPAELKAQLAALEERLG